MLMPTWNPFPLTESSLPKETYEQASLAPYICSTRQAEAAVFPEHRVQDFAFWCGSSWLEGHGGTLAHPQTNGCSCETTESALWQWGQPLAGSPDTMPASIYLYPVETEVFGLVSSRAQHTECTDAEWPIIHNQSLNLNSPLPSSAPLFSPPASVEP